MFPLTHITLTLASNKRPTKLQIRDIISTFLTSEWPSVNPEDINITFKADFTNPQCIVERPKPDDAITGEPLKVFMKFLNASGTSITTFTHLTLSKTHEATLCHEYSLSPRKPGAKVYGLFRTEDGTVGRIDEFLDARNLLPADVEDDGIRADIATALAQFHALPTTLVPGNELAAFYNALIPALEKYHQSEKLKALGREGGVPIDSLINYDFAPRLKAVVKALEAMGAKVGWCIHDVQYMNTMLKHHPEEGESRVALIDFEFTMRNFRGLDVGGHFVQKSFQWFNTTSRLTRCRAYSEAEKLDFCSHYAGEWNRVTGDEDTVEMVLREAELGICLAVAFEVHNMLWFMDENDHRDPLDLEALSRLFEEFEDQYRRIGLREPGYLGH